MSKHEVFDDSFFAALMDELCEEQGQELAEECARLNELDEFENEDARLKRGEETIDRELQHLLRQKRRSAALKSARLLSIAALAVLVVGLASYMAIPQFRSRVQAALDIEPQTTSGIVIVNGGNAATGGVEIRPPEEYEEVSHTYDYTEEGIVETITYRHPETGDEYVVSVLNKYPTFNYDNIIITPPIFSPKPYIDSSSSGYTFSPPSLRSSWDYQTGGGYSSDTNVPGMGYGRYSGYDPNTGAVSLNLVPSVNPYNSNGSSPRPGPTSALPNGSVSNPKPLIPGADYYGRIGP